MAIVRRPTSGRIQFHYNGDVAEQRFTGINPTVSASGLNTVRLQLNVLQTVEVDHAFFTVETELDED